MTTTELSDRLEVSRRTVLRDVAALSAAGVPGYAERGRAGGIVLLPGARLNASHLEPAELEALSVAGLDGPELERLGLAAAQEAASRKIAARQGASAGSSDLPRLADLVLVESAAWFTEPSDTVDVADLASALRRGRRLRVGYRRSGEARASSRVVDPYGLVAKAGRWYLVADADGSGRLFALDRLAAYASLDEPARARPGQTLRSVWDELRQQTEATGAVTVRIRLRADRLDLARRVLGTRIDVVSDPGKAGSGSSGAERADGGSGWCAAVVRYPDVESVRQLLQFGNHIEVLGPDDARERVRELAADLAARHAEPA
jgi:predicted DNA-binding transcriptional regulator YafY